VYKKRTADLVNQYFGTVYTEKLTSMEKCYSSRQKRILLLQVRTTKKELESALSSYPNLLKDVNEEATEEALRDYEDFKEQLQQTIEHNTENT
jgi:hypothetical protein